MTNDRQRKLVALLRTIVERFSEEELRTLCFNLGVDYDDLAGETRAGRARELIKNRESRNRIPELVQEGRKLRPDIAWDNTLEEPREAFADEASILLPQVTTQPKSFIQPAPPLSQATSLSSNAPNTLPDSILIVTVTKVEAQAVLEVFSKAAGKVWTRQPIGNKTYYNLGVHGGAPVFMVQSEMGTATLGGALLTVHQAIQDLHPQAVIMCGIAFGLRPDKQKLGDILVAQQLQYYEPQKVDLKRGQMPRGDRATASGRLLDRFRSGDNDWQGAPRHFGLVLSGEKLVNNPTFRNKLLKTAPEAIGGEMEGAGLYAAAREAKVDWILVKAICDWADGTKNDNAQPLAARNAAQFVLYVLQLGGWGRPEQLPPPNLSPVPKPAPTKRSCDVRIIVAITASIGVILAALVGYWGVQKVRVASWATQTAEARLTQITRTVTATPSQVPPSPTATATVTLTPVASATPTPTPTCPYLGKTDQETLVNLIRAEAEAVNKGNNGGIGIIQVIFAPTAVISNAVAAGEWSTDPVDHYMKLFAGTAYTEAEHFDIRQVGPEATGNIAYFTSGSKGFWRIGSGAWTPYTNTSHLNPVTPFGSDHWTFGKNGSGCWVITRFVFNAGHIPFPP